MLLTILASFIIATGSGPMDAALRATEAPPTLRAAFTVEMVSARASRIYTYDPRLPRPERWQLTEAIGEDSELDEAAFDWASEAAPDGRLFPDDLRMSLGPQVEIEDLGQAWRVAFHHTPSANDGAFDIWAAKRLAATAWLEPTGDRFLRIDYSLPRPVRGPEGGRLTRYEQTYWLETEPEWGMSYVAAFQVEMEGRAAFRTIRRAYEARITKAEFFFASETAEKAFADLQQVGSQ